MKRLHASAEGFVPYLAHFPISDFFIIDPTLTGISIVVVLLTISCKTILRNIILIIIIKQKTQPAKTVGFTTMIRFIDIDSTYF